MALTRIHPFFRHFGLFILLTAFLLSLSALYVKQEKNALYVWDFANYQNKTEDLAQHFKISSDAGWKRFEHYLLTEYNAFPCIPILWAFLLFQNSRLVFIVALALIYLLSYCLLCGTAGALICRNERSKSFWIFAFTSAVLPCSWYSILRGYPDLGAAGLILTASLVFLKDLSLKNARRAFLTGLLLALSILMRRHFAYCARGFLIAAGLQAVLTFASTCRPNFKKASLILTKETGLILFTALSCFVVMKLLAPPFVQEILQTNYRGLYRSYEFPLPEVLRQYGTLYGLGVLAISALGLAVTQKHSEIHTQRLRFLILLGMLLALQWFLVGKQYGLHYALHFNFLMTAGAGFFISHLSKLPSKKWRAALGLVFLFLISNLFVSLHPKGKLPNPVSFLFSQNEAPLTRTDISEIKRLVDFLRDKLPFQSPVYVIGSSWDFNTDLIYQAERHFYTADETQIKLLSAAHLDSRDFYPLQNIINADYAVLAAPLALHHSPERQKVTVIPYRIFTENQELARDFVRLPEEFLLQNNTKVWIYKRVRITPLPVALRALQEMEKEIPIRPGSQSDWIVLNDSLKAQVIYKPNRPVDFLLRNAPETSLLYFGKIPRKLILSARIVSQESSKEILSSRFSFKSLSLDGRTIRENAAIVRTGTPIEIPLDGTEASYLQLSIECEARCSLSAENVTVKESL